MFKQITRTVWIVSLVSLFNDFSSEMLYPVVPLYLKQIGYGTLLIGILEGVAEFLSGFSKMYTGTLSDQFQKRLPFVQWGYFMSVLSRPLIGLSSFAALIFAGRSIDRIGKGIRSGARDAILSDECTENNKAEVFGFHRSMDTLGAIFGPLVAMVYLYYRPGHLVDLFFITLIPGLMAVFLTTFIKEKKTQQAEQKVSYSIRKNLSYYAYAPKAYLILLIPLLLFSLVNSSDMFLLLKAKDAGLSDQQTIFLYLLFNLVFALFAFPLGKLADKFGRTRIYVIGLFIFSLTYFVFAWSTSLYLIIGLFITYGLFYAMTQGIVKAMILQRVAADQKATAIGFYEGLNSIGLLLANTLAGFIWYQFGASCLFYYTGIVTLVCIGLLIIVVSKQKQLSK